LAVLALPDGLFSDTLPCWKDLTEEKRQRRAAAMVADIEAAARRKKTGVKPIGPAAILTQDPHRQPARTKKSPAPAFHAASQAVRRRLCKAYVLFVAAYPKPPRNFGRGTSIRAFQPGVSRQGCRSWAGKPVRAVFLT
jgi:hypothetical protein